MSKLRVLDLFSGIGGFSLGLERTGGFETVAFCEIDPFCQKVLKKHWPDVPIHDDVRTLDGSQYSPDIICGGYPCQGESLAGKRRGAEDDRWLWPEYCRLVETLRPAWVIGENVVGHITMGLDSVLSDLEAFGYAVQAFVIPACALDAKHRRDRVWTVAHAGSEQHQGGGDALEGKIAPVLPVADASGAGLSGLRGASGVQAKHPDDGQHGWWPPEPDVCRVAYGVPGRVDRLRALGNAVVPQIPEIIGRAILEAEGM